MPEYLAPGVYVEETSFRAKSIEGVGTSTTAFAGPTRKGPLAESGSPLELLTSFGDFERLYGGLEDLQFGPTNPPTSVSNYLAHGVLNYFNEGGARLYVARVANGAAIAATSNLGSGAGLDTADSVSVRARFGGSGGNGRVTLAEVATPITASQLDVPPDGSLLRVSDPAARPAALLGGPLPANLSGLGSATVRINLNLNVNGTSRTIGFAGQSAALTATANLVEPVIIGPADREFRLRVNGELQTVQLPEIPAPGVSAANFLVTLNGLLTGIGVTATLATNRLTLTTTRRGSTASIQVLAARLGFAEGASSTATDSNVADLAVVGFAEIRDRVAALNATLPEPVLEVIEVPGGRFALRTLLAASTARLAVGPVAGPAEVSPQALLGLPEAGPPGASGAGVAASFFQRSTVAGSGVWHVPGNTASPLVLGSLANRNLHLLSFSAEFVDADGASSLYEDLALGRDHPRFVGTLLAQNPTARADALAQPIWFGIGNNVNPLVLLTALFPARAVRVEDDRRVVTHSLTGGNDGVAPVVGAPTDPGTYAAAFELLRALEDVAIVAAPGHSDYPAAEAIRAALIAHAERPRAYRIAVLDPPPRQLPGGVQAYRAQIDSHRAALYYPWVTVPNPLSRPGRAGLPKEINLPPSAFICGIYARNDVEKGVSKAPANEVVRGALRFERDINFAQNQLLNPLGVNCLRYFPGRGYRVWGARTASSDPEWKYVNVRRYFNYLEASIDRGTQWAVFENNGERLWANIRETIEDFLYNEWISGNLLGSSPKEAFFVRCDRSTMTQNDLDNGRLICLIGVAALKPAEFVIFRIGQKTADARS